MTFHPHRLRLLLLLAVAAMLGGGVFLWGLWPARSPSDAADELEPDEDDASLAIEAPTQADPPESLRRAAKEVVAALVQSYPDDPEALNVGARLEAGLGNSAEAVALWQRCLDRDPSHAAAHSGLAFAALERGDYEKAVEMLRRVIVLDPRDPRAAVLLGECLVRLGRMEEVCRELGPAFEKGMAPPGAAAVLGQARLQLGQLDEARKVFEAAPKDDKRAQYGLAMIYSRLGQPEKSRQHMEEFRRLSAAGREVHVERIRSFDDQGSLRDFAVETHVDSARIYLKHGSEERAEELWRRAAAMDLKNVPCRSELAALYERAGRDRDALRVCRQLRAIDPQNADYWFNVGVLHARLRRTRAARSEIEKAIQLDPQNPRYREAYEAIQREGSGR